MGDTATVEVASESIADLLARLGDIPAERLRIPPAPGAASEEDVLAALRLPQKRICELIDGVLVEKAMGYRESQLAALLIELINLFVRPRNLGIVSGADGMMRLFAGRIRIPDVGFTSWERFPNRRRPRQPVPHIAPDLAVEVLSDSNTPAEMLAYLPGIERVDAHTARFRAPSFIDVTRFLEFSISYRAGLTP